MAQPNDAEMESTNGGVADLNDSPSTSKSHGRLRMRTNTAEIDNTITHPGSVKINVKGAFIVDHENGSPNNSSISGGSHDTKDIRLPNHTAVVSHIAVDVSCKSLGIITSL
jgi:type II pantothenate kinase